MITSFSAEKELVVMLLRLLGQFLARKSTSFGNRAATQADTEPSTPTISEEEARRMVALMPHCAEAHNYLGITYSSAGKLAAAEAEFFLATKLSRSDASAHFNLGKVLAATHRPSAAEASYRRALELRPGFAEAHHGLGSILAATGRPEEAEASYRLALQSRPDFAAALENLEKVLEDRERLTESETALRSALESTPDSAEAHLQLGVRLCKSKRLDEAEAAVHAAIGLQPKNAAAHFTLGTIFQNTDRPFEAEKAYRQALKLQDDFVEAHHNLGVVLALSQRFDEAEACYRRAMALDPDSASARVDLGVVLEKTCRLRDAEACYRQALLAVPDSEKAQQSLDNVLQEIRRLSDAASACRRDLKRVPGDLYSHNKLGLALMALGQPDQAELVFQQAIALEPLHADAHNNLGMTCIIQGKIDAAIACFLRAVSTTPQFSKAMSNLGAAFLRKGDFSQAAKWSHAALAIDPRHVDANYHMAVISLETGRLEEARQYLRYARGRPPSLGIENALNPSRAVLVLGTTTRAGNMSPLTVEFLLPATINTRITWAVDLADDGQAGDMPYYDVAFNVMGDPDITGDINRPLSGFLETRTKPVLNHPGKVLRTARDNLPSLFSGIDNLLVPDVWRFADSAAWDDSVLHRLPLLIRPVESHGGVGLVLVKTSDELAQVRGSQSSPVYVSCFVDFRSRDNCFRKYRTIFIDRVPYPYHLAISPDWMVHYYTAGMESHAWKLDEEKAFLQNPDAVLGSAGAQAIRSIGARMDLDYAGIDFSIMPDGRILVFEANPAMLIHPENIGGPTAHKNSYIFRIAEKFEEMLVKKTSGTAEI